MELALDGQCGSVDTFDYRGHALIAAYGLLAPARGLVAKQDAHEAFALIRETLANALPLTMLLTLGGAVPMYGRLNPLVARLRWSEMKAKDLRRAFPEMKGLSLRNLRYIRTSAAAFKEREIVQRVVAQLPLGAGDGIRPVRSRKTSTRIQIREGQAETLCRRGRLEAVMRTHCSVPGHPTVRPNVRLRPPTGQLSQPGLFPVPLADSTGQRNTLTEHLSRGLEAERLPGALVQLSRNGIEFDLREF